MHLFSILETRVITVRVAPELPTASRFVNVCKLFFRFLRVSPSDPLLLPYVATLFHYLPFANLARLRQVATERKQPLGEGRPPAITPHEVELIAEEESGAFDA